MFCRQQVGEGRVAKNKMCQKRSVSTIMAGIIAAHQLNAPIPYTFTPVQVPLCPSPTLSLLPSRVIHSFEYDSQCSLIPDLVFRYLGYQYDSHSYPFTLSRVIHSFEYDS